MDELEPTVRHNHRRRRRGTAGIITAVLLALIGAAIGDHNGSNPSAVAPTVSPSSSQSPTNQVLSAKDTVLNAQPGLWHVGHVVDGDTIDVTLGKQKETVRLLGIDTPETHDPRKPVQCFGEAAAAHTRALLENQNIRLEPDPQDSDRDKYRRLLRYVYLPDGTLINAALVRDGYAFVYTVFPLAKLDEFRALEQQAREANRGLWAGCNIDESKQIKQTAGNK